MTEQDIPREEPEEKKRCPVCGEDPGEDGLCKKCGKCSKCCDCGEFQ